jgi:hypothetical protein
MALDGRPFCHALLHLPHLRLAIRLWRDLPDRSVTVPSSPAEGNGKLKSNIVTHTTEEEELKGNKYVREVDGFNSRYWCDYCRCFTDAPEEHKHG